MRLPRAGAPGDWASTASIGLAVAAALLAGAIGMATMMENKPAGVDPRKAEFDAEAATALDVIVHDPGLTSAGVVNWAQTPDVLTRFGLALPGQPNFVDYQKIKSMRNGTLVANATNNAPDYPEVKAALGLKDADFHLRTYPVLPSLDDPHWTKDATGRIAYIGQYQGANVPITMTTTYVKNAVAMNVSVNITNVGNIPAIFVADIVAKHHGNLVHSSGQEMNTILLQPGQSQVVWGNFTAISSWHPDVKEVEVDVTDPFGNPATDSNGVVIPPYIVADVPPGGGASNYAVYVSAADRYDVSGAQVKFAVYALDGKGGRPSGATGRFVLMGPDGREWQNYSISFNTTSDWMATCGNCTTPGVYTGYAWDGGLTTRKQDQVVVSATPLFTQKDVQSANATSEVGALSAISSNFTAVRFNNTTFTGGDVYGDDYNGAGDLLGVMSRYSTIVVGSEVSQNTLNTPNFRNAISAWVANGGNLVVLGTNTQQSSWLQNIYQAAQANANGGISAPDVTHPILVTPNHLQYGEYLDRGRAWAIDSAEPFTHVLTRGASGSNVDDTLSVANPGALGNGTVVLTSYMPAQLTPTNDPVEEERFLQNLLAQRYNMLFLDFGPPIPDGVAVGSDQRLVAIPHPNVPGAVVEVRLVMYVFG